MRKKIVLPHFIFSLEQKTVSLREKPTLRIIVTRKVGSAVDRNRIKRVLREFFRQKMGLLPWDLVICRVAPGTAKVKNAELFQELNKIIS